MIYKHILVATDGSAASRNAVRSAVGLARSLGSRLTALHVMPPHDFSFYGDYVPADFIPSKQYEQMVKKTGSRYLDAVKKAAAGVRVKGLQVTGSRPYEEILKAARNNGCDLIVMASQSRGISRLLLGSQTAKVLANATIPVMVVR
jgi:nucleotide-binding universal stress UspA family protein